MSLVDVWHELQFFMIDLAVYTNAERQVNKYKKVIEKLKAQISDCTGELSYLKEIGDRINNQYLINENSAKGKLMDYFNEKEALWNDNRENILSKMDDALKIANERKTEAENLLAYWEGVVEREEAELRSELWNRQEAERREAERREAERREAERREREDVERKEVVI